MKSWIVLLRGVNVGGKHIVPMRELKARMEEAGFSNVRTYIQSGNIVLEKESRPAYEISDLIEQNFGFRPAVFVLSRREFERAMMNNPFDSGAGQAVHFSFCNKVPTSVDYDLLESLKDDSEQFSLIGNVVYLSAPKGIGRSVLFQRMGKAFPGIDMTARNMNTINKLADMLGESDS